MGWFRYGQHRGCLQYCWDAAKKLIKQLKCSECQSSLVGVDTDLPFFHQLSRGGLIIPSWGLANIFCKGFAILDAADHVILQHSQFVQKVWYKNFGQYFFITTNNEFLPMQ